MITKGTLIVSKQSGKIFQTMSDSFKIQDFDSESYYYVYSRDGVNRIPSASLEELFYITTTFTIKRSRSNKYSSKMNTNLWNISILDENKQEMAIFTVNTEEMKEFFKNSRKYSIDCKGYINENKVFVIVEMENGYER